MPATVRRFAFVAAIAYAVAPAWGAGMPDYGTKNFSPGGATPSYFTHENSAILGTAENENAEDGADTPAGSMPASPEVLHADRAPEYRTGRHHGRLAGRSFEAHAARDSRARGHAARSAADGARGGSNGRPAGRWAHAATSARSFRSGAARPAKTATRHASARSWSRKG